MPKTYEICFKYRNWNRDQSTFDKWWWSLSVFHVFLVSLAVQMFEIYSQNHRPAAPNLDAKTFKTSVSEKKHRTVKRTKTSLRIQFWIDDI